MYAQRSQDTKTEPRDGLAAMAIQGGESGGNGDPVCRVQRVVSHSISLSPAEREGQYAQNPGELAVGNLVELKTEFDRVKKSFITLPDQVA